MIEFYAYYITVGAKAFHYHAACLEDPEVNPANRTPEDLEEHYTKIRLDEMADGLMCNHCNGEVSTRGLKQSLEVTKEHRNMPWLEYGMIIEMDGERGIVRGGNSSANLDVEFPGQDWLSNVHPYWETVYYDKDSNIIADYREKGKA